MFSDFNMILWFISIKLNILGTLKFNMQVHVVIPQIFFVFQILCKYSLGLFLLTMHSRKGWHLDRTEGPAIIASLIKKKNFAFLTVVWAICITLYPSSVHLSHFYLLQNQWANLITLSWFRTNQSGLFP